VTVVVQPFSNIGGDDLRIPSTEGISYHMRQEALLLVCQLILPFYDLSSNTNNLENKQKTYNSGDSPVVTHLTTNPPVTSLSTAERTGSAIFLNLWSYVNEMTIV
jgi:hypothetical protein